MRRGRLAQPLACITEPVLAVLGWGSHGGASTPSWAHSSEPFYAVSNSGNFRSCMLTHLVARQLRGGGMGTRWEGQLGLQMCVERERIIRQWTLKRLLFPAPCSTCNLPSSFQPVATCSSLGNRPVGSTVTCGLQAARSIG